MVISYLANIVQGGGGMFYLGLGYPQIRQKTRQVSHQFCIRPILVFVCVYWEGSPGGGPESVNLNCWSQLHLGELQGEPVVFVVAPVDSLVALRVPQVPPIQVGVVTSPVPPGAC